MRTWPALDIQQADPDELLHAFLIDFNVAAIEDSRFFFHTSDDRDRAAAALRAAFPALAVLAIDVADEDWAARSQAALRAIQVGNIVVAPPWDLPAATGGDQTSVGAGSSRPPLMHAIIIQPSMGFGTGHHATTRLCLAALQQLDLQHRSVIDVGTGSGVLAIAARRLGASGVLALDNDPDAIAAAEENVALNQASRIALEVADFRESKIGQFDVLVSNLTGVLLIASAGRLQELVVAGGDIVISGFLTDEQPDVLAAFSASDAVKITQEDDWICAVLRRR